MSHVSNKGRHDIFDEGGGGGGNTMNCSVPCINKRRHNIFGGVVVTIVTYVPKDKHNHGVVLMFCLLL